MSAQDTSILAYEYITATKKMGYRKLEVFDALKNLKVATNYEITTYLGKEYPNYVRPRRFELVNKLKVVGYAGKRKCKITNRIALTWKLLNLMPRDKK